MNTEEITALKSNRKVSMLTAYDYQTARILEAAGIDMILVGDSLGNVILGYEGTRQVTMEDMIRHIGAVRRGAPHTYIVGDMPVDTYDNVEDALRNASKLMEAGATAVKLEGNQALIVRSLITVGIPVQGHLGLLPQTATDMKVKGKEKTEAERIYEEALFLDAAGVFSIVLECIPVKLATRITDAVKGVTIGIGAGPNCDGQVLVINDMLGMMAGFKPKHVKQYANLYEIIGDATRAYIGEVKDGKFPDDEHSFH
jgi:3-methyl-2-oxobutanoate hydroxymethyltransferase